METNTASKMTTNTTRTEVDAARARVREAQSDVERIEDSIACEEWAGAEDPDYQRRVDESALIVAQRDLDRAMVLAAEAVLWALEDAGCTDVARLDAARRDVDAARSQLRA